MRNQKKMKWTDVEQAALVAGVRKYGTGKWSHILNDAEFGSVLGKRSNIDLKDKWRNMAVARGERPRYSKPICLAPLPSAAGNHISGSVPALLTAPTLDAKTDAALSASAIEPPEPKSDSEIDSMIFEALKASNTSKGSDIGMIVRYIEERYEAPPNVKKLLAQKLRCLVSKGIINKVEKHYTIKNDSVAIVNGVDMKQKHSKPRNSPSRESNSWLESLTNAAETAAYKIAVSEKKSVHAKEALEEAKRVSKLAEESYRFLEIVKDIYERCSRGESVYINLKSDEE